MELQRREFLRNVGVGTIATAAGVAGSSSILQACAAAVPTTVGTSSALRFIAKQVLEAFVQEIVGDVYEEIKDVVGSAYSLVSDQLGGKVSGSITTASADPTDTRTYPCVVLGERLDKGAPIIETAIGGANMCLPGALTLGLARYADWLTHRTFQDPTFSGGSEQDVRAFQSQLLSVYPSYSTQSGSSNMRHESVFWCTTRRLPNRQPLSIEVKWVPSTGPGTQSRIEVRQGIADPDRLPVWDENLTLVERWAWEEFKVFEA